MFCKFCGKPMEETESVCPACGRETNDPTLPPPGLRRGQFYRKHFRCRRGLCAAGILCYAAALLSLLAADPSMLYWALVDAGILVFFGGLMHLLRSRAAAVVVAVYALACLLSVFVNGFLGLLPLLTAVLVLLAAGLGVCCTFRFARAWKAYRVKTR